jgi:hypothetical protein
MRYVAKAFFVATVIAAIAVVSTIAGAGRGPVAAARAANTVPSYARGLNVLPFPGTPDAPAGTPIDFPAIAPAQIASVKAIGARSGVHTGRLSAQPAGHGTAFTPARPFIPGERVMVTAVLRSASAAAASGAPGSNALRFSFSVARGGSFASSSPATSPDSLGLVGPSAAANAAGTTHSFVTQPHFHAPVVSMSGTDTDTASGDIFLDAQNSGQNAPYMLDYRGDLLWYHPTSGSGAGPAAFNTRVQSLSGQSVLTYWQGHVVFPPGGGRGDGVIMNEHYQVIHKVTAGAGYQKQGTDLHEFTLGHEGSEATAFVTVWSPVQANLTSVGGPSKGTVFDWIIQEIDVNTNKVIWQWHSLGHVPIRDSYLKYTPGQPYDYFHLNSIQQLANGHIVISARHTWAVYSIDKATGKIMWELGGKHSSFKLGSGVRFAWQHHATMHNNGLLTVFDDGRGGGVAIESQSRALEIHLSLAKRQATLVHAYTHKPTPAKAASMGSTELLNGGNVFVGWGSSPYFSEYTPGGTQIFGGAFHSPVDSYRAYRFSNFVGQPLGPPAIAVRKSSAAGHDSVYASWNGSTTVAKWQVLGSSSAGGPFTNVGSPVPWSSFETTIQVPANAGPYFEVQALDASGHPIPGGTSSAVKGP